MANYSFVEIEQIWIKNGGNGAWAPLMAGIALAESGGNASASNPSDPYGGSYGLWQINGSHAPGGRASAPWIATIKTPNANAQEAVALFATAKGVNAWRTDPLWKQWMAAGAPRTPTPATVVGWLNKAGVGGTHNTVLPPGWASPLGTHAAAPPGVVTTKTTQTKAKTSPTGQCVLALPNPFPFTSGKWCILSKSQLKALKGGTAVAAGALIGTMGVLAIIASGFGSSGASKALGSLSGALPGPVRTPLQAASGRRQRRRTEEGAELRLERSRQATTRSQLTTGEALGRSMNRPTRTAASAGGEPPFTSADETPGLHERTRAARRQPRTRRPREGARA